MILTSLVIVASYFQLWCLGKEPVLRPACDGDGNGLNDRSRLCASNKMQPLQDTVSEA